MKPLRFVAITTILVAAACSSPSPGGDAPKPVLGEAKPAYAAVAHRDPRLGVPTFAWISKRDLPEFADVHEAVAGVTERVAQAFELHEGMISTLGKLEIDHATRGPVIAHYTQSIGDVEVFRGGVSIAMTRAFEPVSASGLLAPSREGSERPFSIDVPTAVAKAIAVVSGRTTSEPISAVETLHGYERFTARGLQWPARAKKVFFPKKDGLEPGYYIEVSFVRGPARSLVVSAIDGRVLFTNDLVRHDFTYKVWADATTKIPMDGPQGNGFIPHPTGKPDGTKLTYVSQQLVTLNNFPFSKNDPWLPADATTTEGNNVTAYADLVAPDGFDEATDVRATLTDTATFGTAYDLNQAPSATTDNSKASVQHLFYLTNFLHDWYYDEGFDEMAKNHQSDNFGRGGKGGDPLRAEAQDNSGRNNANAQVPADGQSPIIQMYIFSGPTNASLTVNSPSSIAGVKNTGIASGFGKDTFDTTGDVVLAQDGTGADMADACEPLTNDVTGKIVLAHRGTCSFAQKVQNAEAGGAIACIIANVAASVDPTTAPFMGGQQSGINIPALSLNLADGQALEGAISLGATNVTMHRALGVDLDGGIDTTIAAHEWGHVISGRLINDGAGLTTNQAGGLGEGWGDFSALMVAIREDDPGNFGGAYTNGSYAESGSGPDIYFGTRRVPYSVDMTKNALTFKHIMNGNALPTGVPTAFGEDGSFNSEVHSTGEVWATMLFECYVSLLRDTTRLTFKDAQERMKRYFVASLKLTPPDPTLLEARDAVLAAAYAADANDFKLFFEAFARRGAGAGATGPAKDSTNNGPVTESFFAGNDVTVTKATLKDDVITCDHDNILDEGEVGTIELELRNSGSGTTNATIAHATSATPGVVFELADTKVPDMKPFETSKIAIKAHVTGPKPADAIELDITFDDTTFSPQRKIEVKLPTYYDADEAPDASATDHVDTKKTAWKATGDDGVTDPWARVTDPANPSNQYWAIPNAFEVSDHSLVSPRFIIDDKTFSLSFRHRFSFRRSQRRGTNIDGGVLEYSTDGKTWKDLSEVGNVDYTTTLDTGGRGDNVLKGRKAYGGVSMGYPNDWLTSKIDIALPDHPDFLQIRFRMSTGSGFFGADGWNIDDIVLDGIASTPFYSYVPQTDACDPDAPTVNAGASKTAPPHAHVTLDGSGSSPKNLPLTFLWRQVAGPTVTLENANSPTPAFTTLGEVGTKYTFELRAHDGQLLSPASSVDVTVADAGSGNDDDNGCSCRVVTSSSSSRNAMGIGLSALALALVAARRRRRG